MDWRKPNEPCASFWPGSLTRHIWACTGMSAVDMLYIIRKWQDVAMQPLATVNVWNGLPSDFAIADRLQTTAQDTAVQSLV